MTESTLDKIADRMRGCITVDKTIYGTFLCL